MRTIDHELCPRDKKDKHSFERDHSLVSKMLVLQQVDTVRMYIPRTS